MMTGRSEQTAQLRVSIAGLEAQRALLGDAVVEPALAALRRQLADLEEPEPAPAPPAPSLEGERKLVTVLFADISGFTALAERRDPEQVRSLMNACFEQLVPVVERYGGTIDKFMGDAILALFGAPVAHENDPERALRAALEMTDALAAFNARQKTELGLHFGINTGRVIAGGIGSSGRQEYSVMGDAVNLAARLEDASENGEILVGPDTYRLTAPLFDFEALPPLSLKGKTEPVPVYRLLGLRRAPEPTRGIIGLRSSLVGRREEQAQMKAALDALVRGQGSAVAVIGEAGLGKSRLVAETRRDALAAGNPITWIEGRALSYAENVSYGVARDILRGLLDVDVETPPDQVMKTLREQVGRRFPASAEETAALLVRLLEIPLDGAIAERVADLSAEALRRRMIQAFADFVHARARETPLVLVWEDLHWADPSSLAVLESLLPVAPDIPLLLVLVYRPDDQQGYLIDSRLVPDESCVRIELAPLTRDESTELLHNLLRIENLPDEISRCILEKAEGNAFFLEEVLRSLMEAGVVVLQGDRAVATRAVEAVDVPDTLEGVIAARVDRLPASEKGTLQTASVIGRVFQQRVLAHVLSDNVADGRLPGQLAALRQREFIRLRENGATLSPDLEYIFKHVLTQEVTYSSLLIARRKELHRVAGEAIESLFPDFLGELAPTLAYHFERAELPEKAIVYFTQAGDRARATFANAEALAFYRAALRQADSVLADDAVSAEQKERCRAVAAQSQENIGDLLELMGRHDEARSVYEDAFARVPAQECFGRSRLHRKIASTWQMQRRYEEALRALDSAEAVLDTAAGERDATWWREWIENQLGRMHVHYWTVNVSEMEKIATAIQPTVEQYGTPLQRSVFFYRLSGLILRRDILTGLRPTSDEALKYSLSALATTEEAGDLDRIAEMRFIVGFCFLWLGHLDSAEEYLRRALTEAERTGNITTQSRCLIYLALVYRKQARTNDVRRYASRSLAVAASGQMVEYIAMAKAHQAWLAWRDGDHAAARALGHEALELWHGMPVPYTFDWMALWPLVGVALTEGRNEEALEHARGMFAPTQQRLPETLAHAVEEAVRTWDGGERELAIARLRQAFPPAQELGYL